MATIHLQDLVGSQVIDGDGKRMGRVEAIRAEIDGEDLVIREYLLGPAAFLHRLGMSALGLIGMAMREPKRIPWDQLDISDPKRPKMR